MKWSDKEIETLKKMYPTDLLMSEIMKELPRRSHNSIRLKASRLGLKRPIREIDLTALALFNLDWGDYIEQN